MILHLLLTFIAGYFAHFTYLITSRLSNGWSQLCAYTLGVVFCLPAVIVIYRDLSDITDPVKRLVSAYLLAYLAFGGGTGLGWFLHPIDHPIVSMMDDGGIR
jgi:hypothetical protein